MSEIPVYVLLMHGDLHPRGILTFNQFLRNGVGIPRDRIYLMNRREDPEREIMKFLGLLPQSQRANVVVCSDAHGEPGVFTLNGRDIQYPRFATYFDINGDLIFLNNACFSGSCIDAFIESGLLPDRSMVIASSRHNEETYSFRLFNQLIAAYSRQQEYKPRRLGHLMRVRPSQTGKPRKIKIGHRAASLIDAEEIRTTDYDDRRQHPIKEGKSLDYLLFARQNAAQ